MASVLELREHPSDARQIIRVLLPAVALALNVLDAEGAMAAIAMHDVPLEGRSSSFRVHLNSAGAKCRSLMPTGEGVASILATKWGIDYLMDTD